MVKVVLENIGYRGIDGARCRGIQPKTSMVSGIHASEAWDLIGEPAWRSEYDCGQNIGTYDFDYLLDVGVSYLTPRLKFRPEIADMGTFAFSTWRKAGAGGCKIESDAIGNGKRRRIGGNTHHPQRAIKEITISRFHGINLRGACSSKENGRISPNDIPILSQQDHYGSWGGNMAPWAKGLYYTRHVTGLITYRHN